MNAPKAPQRRLPARRDDALPSFPAPNGLSLSSSSSSSSSSFSSTQRPRFAAPGEKKSDGFASILSLGAGSGGGGSGGTAGSISAATPHKVWLGSLPSTLTEVELRERLGCFGTIQSFFFKPEQPGAVAALATADQQHSKKARGWAFVSYATAEEAQALIRAFDGKLPDACFPVAAASLAAPGTAPPVEARLANASKSSGIVSLTSGASDTRTNYSEDELHSREKLLALAFFSPTHKPSAAGRASSLAPPSAAGESTRGGDPSNNSSVRCSSHPRITNSNSSSMDRADGGSGVYSGSHRGATPLSRDQSEQFPYSSISGGGGGGSPSSPSSATSTTFPPRQNSRFGLSHAEQQRQQLKLLLAEEDAPPPPAHTSFPPAPAGSVSFGFPQLATNSDKSTVAKTTAEDSVKKSGDAVAVTPAPAAAETTAAGVAATPSTEGEGGGAPLSNTAPSSAQEQQQQRQPAPDGTSATAAAAQRGKRVYGGLHAAAFPPLSAAAAVNTGGHGGRPQQQQQQNRPDVPNLPSLWEVYWTPDTRQPYYYNAISKHVQWERPLPPREYVEQYGNPMTAELGLPAPLIPGMTRGVVAGKGGAVVGPQGSNLFVFHLPPEWSEQTFLRHFAPFGNVVSCKIQINAQTGKRGGFGFVSYDNPASAIASIRMLNGFGACGKMLKVQLKKGEEHMLPPDLQQQQQQQQQQQHQQHQQQQQGMHLPHAPPPMGFTWSAAAS